MGIMANLTSNIIEVEDTLEAANDWFCREKLSDGLPIVPPTPERVGRMVDGTHRDSQEVIGLIPPKWAPKMRKSWRETASPRLRSSNISGNTRRCRLPVFRRGKATRAMR